MKSLEKEAVRCATHLDEFFDQEELNYFVKWSTQKKYYPYEAMIFLHRQVKKDFHNNQTEFLMKHYMDFTHLYFLAKRFKLEEIKDDNIRGNRKDKK